MGIIVAFVLTIPLADLFWHLTVPHVLAVAFLGPTLVMGGEDDPMHPIESQADIAAEIDGEVALAVLVAR